MIQVFLVDDELFMRSYLKTLIDWEKEGYHICGEYSDGDQAIRALSSIQPDIILTDIKMNRIYGNELVRYVREHYPDICTIILSGYDDYEYVHDTFNCNAVDYLLKTDLNERCLLEALEKAKARMEERRRRQIRKSSSNIEALLRKNTLQLIGGYYHYEENAILTDFKTLGIDLDFTHICPILILADSCPKGDEKNYQEQMLFQMTVCNITNEVIQEEERGFAVHVEKKTFLALISPVCEYSEEGIRRCILKLLRRISFCLKQYMNISASYCVGRPGTLYQLEDGYKELEKKAEVLFFRKPGMIVMYDEVIPENKREDGMGLSAAEEAFLKNACQKMDVQAVQEKLRHIFSSFEKQEDKKRAFKILNELVFLLIYEGKRNDIPMERISGSREIGEYLKQLPYLPECVQFLEECFERLIEEMKCQKEAMDAYSEPVKRILIFLNQQYQEPISLIDVADELRCSSSYVSAIFKKETGMTVIEYLNDLRLANAKEMIEAGNEKLKTVMKKNGFQNYPYFSNLFRKKFGMSPAQCRKRSGRPKRQ